MTWRLPLCVFIALFVGWQFGSLFGTRNRPLERLENMQAALVQIDSMTTDQSAAILKADSIVTNGECELTEIQFALAQIK